MLLEEFSFSRDAVINPDMVTTPVADFPAVTISCFSKTLFDSALSQFEPKLLVELRSAVGRNPVYEVCYQGQRFALFQSYVGEPSCVGQYEDLIAIGSRQLILLGNCGVLDRSIEDCGIIIPTLALRDEGTSYHYAPPSDRIAVNRKYRKEFQDVLRQFGYPFVEGTTWTTDAPYRETREKVARRRAQGAICVEMECAGMQALCDFRNTGFFQFFYAGDNLDHSTWQPRSFSGDVRLDDKTKIMFLAFELGLKIMQAGE
ncbi:MAG: nucleoside phosphorylase [Oscillospiraceae bacterium]|nr:nucleoside phosphorylase [Oscillospiraceae bacterium]